MDIARIPKGARLILEDGSIVGVVEASNGSSSVRVRYIEAPFDPKLVGTEAACTDYEIVGFAEGEGLDSSQ